MISAVQQADREQERKRARAAGPAFTVPSLPIGPAAAAFPALPGLAIGTIGPSLPFGGKGEAPAPACAVGGAAPAALQGLIGRAIGTGQCVALARAVQPDLGPTRNWACGAKVQGDAGLRPGTVIATFDGSGRYANATDGSSHAAVYLGQNGAGIQVLDQWAGSAAAVRTIPWTNPSGVPANTGTAFHVVVPARTG